MKRFIALLMTGLMLSSLWGCRSLTPREQMQKILDQQKKTVSFEADLEGQYAFDFSDSGVSGFIPPYYQQVLKNITLTGHTTYKFALADLPQLGIQLNAGIDGLRFAFELYTKNRDVYAKYPLFHNYIATNLDELYEEYARSVEIKDEVIPQDALERLIKLVTKRIYEKWGGLVIEAIEEDELIYTPKWIVEESGQKKTYQKILWTLSLESHLNILKMLLTDVRADEELYQAVMPLMKESMTFAEYQILMDEMMAGIIESYQQMGENKSEDQYKVNYTLIYKSNYQLQYLETNIKLDTDLDQSVGAVAADYFTKVHFYNQNKLKGVNYPEFTAQNTSRLLDLLKQ